MNQIKQYKQLLKSGCEYQKGTVFIPTAGMRGDPAKIALLGRNIDFPRCTHPDRDPDNMDGCCSNCPLIKEEDA